ncbi:MAG TPA: hypothetical protein VJ716_09710 [Gaiellaceae bacterium]|nr:hypothetical protein [Gaiellaceae bacterium]
MIGRGGRPLHRERVDELLREIDAQRRRQLLLEAAGAYAPGLEREVELTRRQLAELVR